MTGMGGYPDEQLLANARDDAFHGVMMCVGLSQDEPRRLELKGMFEKILETIDGKNG